MRHEGRERWLRACKNYRLEAVPGHMGASQLRWLYETAWHLPAGARALEIGILHGRSTCAILAGMQDAGKGARLICVEHHDRAMFAENIRERGLPLPLLIVGDSRQAVTANRVAAQSLAWVFIDGNHRTEAVIADINNWAPRLAVGGLMSGHDAQMERVRAAVELVYGSYEEPIHGIWAVPSKTKAQR